MGLETGTYISDLQPANPLGTDAKSSGDDHLRLIKAVLKNTFPNANAAVNPTPTEFNYLVGVTSAVQTQFNTLTTNVNSVTTTANAALPKAGGTMTGDLTLLNGVTQMNINIGSSGAYMYGSSTMWGVTKSGGGSMTFDPATGNLTCSGSFTASGNVTAYSDIRLKVDLQVIPDALTKVLALTGYTYTMKSTGQRHLGLVAQEVLGVMPEAVETGAEYLSVAYGNLVGLLVEAIKEQQAQIVELRQLLGVR